MIDELKKLNITDLSTYRLVLTKWPSTSLFDRVASPEDFDLLFDLMAKTNPRLKTELGQYNLVSKEDIPFGIPGAAYAMGPFCHFDPNGTGGRFNSSQYGAFYAALNIETAILEVKHHHEKFALETPDLKHDHFSFRALRCNVSAEMIDIRDLPYSHEFYNSDNYSASQQFGDQVKKSGSDGIIYNSVRDKGNGKNCISMFSPKGINSVIQSQLVHFVWTGSELLHLEDE